VFPCPKQWGWGQVGAMGSVCHTGAFATSVGYVLCLIDACYVFRDCGFPKHIDPLENTLVEEV